MPEKELQYLAAARALLNGDASPSLANHEGITPLVRACAVTECFCEGEVTA